jgi:hypothetical protein
MRENRLRHPRYLGLGDDKDPKNIAKEGMKIAYGNEALRFL